MPRKFQFFLQGDNIYICKRCQTHLASLNDLVSKAFRGQYGTAYLFHDVVNLDLGTTKNQNLATGQHTIADIFVEIVKTPHYYQHLHQHQQDGNMQDFYLYENHIDQSIGRRSKIQIRQVHTRIVMHQTNGQQLI